MIQAEAAMLRDEIRRIDTGTADEIRRTYYGLSDNLEALSNSLLLIRQNHSEKQLPYLAGDHLANYIQTLKDALDDIDAFGIAL